MQCHVTPSFPRAINIKFLLQPHQKYCITQYGELGFSSLTQMQDDCTTNSHYPQLYSSLYKVGRMQFFSRHGGIVTKSNSHTNMTRNLGTSNTPKDTQIGSKQIQDTDANWGSNISHDCRSTHCEFVDNWSTEHVKYSVNDCHTQCLD